MTGAWWGLAAVALLILTLLKGPRLLVIGWTEALRRPRQLPLLALGLMVATGVATFAFVMADSVADSVETEARQALGLTDVAVTTTGLVADDDFDGLLADPDVAFQVERSTTALRLDATASNPRSGQFEPRAKIWGIQDWSGFIHLQPAAGLDARLESLVINEFLAQELDARVGDDITLQVTTPPIREITSLAVDQRVSSGDEATHTFTAPADAARITATTPDANVTLRLVNPEGAVLAPTASATHGDWTLRITNHGDTRTVAATINITHSAAVQQVDVTRSVLAIVAGPTSDPLGDGPRAYTTLAALQDDLGLPGGANTLLVQATTPSATGRLADDLQAEYRPQGTQRYPAAPVDVVDLRAQSLGDAHAAAERFRADTQLFSSFNLLAGFLLAVVLMALVVEERRESLAALRATGAGRSDLVIVHLHEGSVYGILGGILGLVAGLALASAYVALDPFQLGQATTTGLRLHINGSALLNGLGLGFAVTMAGVAAASWRSVRFNVASGLRGILVPTKKRGPWAILLLLAALGLTYLGWRENNPYLLLAGPVLTIFLVANWLARRLPGAVIHSLSGVALIVLAWTRYAPGAPRILLPFLALSLAIGATMILVWSGLPARLGAWLASRFQGLDAVADAGFAYARERRDRTALNVGMLGVLLATLVVVASFATLVAQDTQVHAGGYGVIGTTAVPADVQAADLGLPYHGVTDSIGVTRDLSAAFPLRQLDGRYVDLRDAFFAVAADPDLAISTHGGLGSARILGHDVTVIAAIHSDIATWFVHPSLLDTPGNVTRILAPGGPDTARSLEARYQEARLDAVTVQAVEDERVSQSDARSAFVRLFAGAGLFAGAAAIALIAVRNVIDRRRVIGVMRALGARRAQVLGVFTLEVVFLMLLATVVGLAAGAAASYGTYQVLDDPTMADWHIPWASVAPLVAINFLVAVATTLVPAAQAARGTPATSTRYVE